MKRHQLSQIPQLRPVKRFKSVSRRFFTPLSSHGQVWGILFVYRLPSKVYYSWQWQGLQRAYLWQDTAIFPPLFRDCSFPSQPDRRQTDRRQTVSPPGLLRKDAREQTRMGEPGGRDPPARESEPRRSGRWGERYIPRSGREQGWVRGRGSKTWRGGGGGGGSR